jgi:hypothetical protein
MQSTHLKRLVLDCSRLPLPIAPNPAHPVEAVTPAHPGEGSGNEKASWEAAWIDLGGEAEASAVPVELALDPHPATWAT